jgi:TPR repeat protein
MIYTLPVTFYLIISSAYASYIDPYYYTANFEDYEKCLKSESKERVYELAVYGDPNAQFIVSEGYSLQKLYTEARKWCEESKAGGNLKAMEKLAFYYHNGVGGEPNYKGTYDIYHYFAIQKKIPKYQYLVGTLYDEGIYVRRDMNQAFSWYLFAADSGFKEAQVVVAQLYEFGNVAVKKNINKAIDYYTLAAKQGDRDAIKALSRLTKIGVVKPPEGGL